MRTSTISTECQLTRQALITCSADSFAVESPAKTEFVAGFEEISRVTISKRDEITADLVIFEIELVNGEQFTLHEEMAGFDAFAEKVEQLSGFDKAWRDKVILPPFETCVTIAYIRPS
jgi:hypothetical protein